MKLNGRGIAGAIFDADGTLLDSMPVWENVANQFIIERGITPRENLTETFKTMSLAESAEYYQREYAIKETKEQIVAGINDIIKESYETSILVKEGVPAFLEKLKNYGIPMYIATATDRPFIEAAVTRNEIRKYFNGIITCRDVGQSKESPAVYEEARK